MRVEQMKGCRRRLEVEVPAAAVGEAFRKVTTGWAREARLTGFRKGKAPARMVRQKFAAEIEREVGEQLAREWLVKALAEEKLHPLHDPVLESLDLKDGSPMVFRALFDVHPEIRLGTYTGARVTATRAAVTDERVAEQIESIRARSATFLPVTGRAAAAGDYLVGALVAAPAAAGTAGDQDPKAAPAPPERTVALDLGADDVLPEFRDSLPGLAIGEERTVTVTYPKEHGEAELSGRRVVYQFRLKEIKQQQLPALDDALAKQVGEFDTLEELRAAVRKELEVRVERDWQAESRHQVLEHALAAHDFEAPESLVESELRGRVEEILRLVRLQDWEKEKAEKLWHQEWQRQRPAAERGVRATLLLEAIAAAETIEVTEEECNERLRVEASRRGRTVSSLKDEIARGGGWKSLQQTVLREKALDFLMKNANIPQEDS